MEEVKGKLLVYVCSPLRGDIEGNLERAARYSRQVMWNGHVPITPHLYFSSFLDDTQPLQRSLGMSMGMTMLSLCDELWCFGEMSDGMRAEVIEARRLGIKIRMMDA